MKDFLSKIDYMLQLKINRHSLCFSEGQPTAQPETYDFSNVNGTSEGPTTEERIQLAFFETANHCQDHDIPELQVCFSSEQGSRNISPSKGFGCRKFLLRPLNQDGSRTAQQHSFSEGNNISALMVSWVLASRMSNYRSWQASSVSNGF